jgi:hypothetical protein
MAANYNNSAWFYDKLARLVYGSELVDAQVYLLKFVPPNSNVLIVGGGTGWILEELSKIHSSGLNITYVEVAPAMMARSHKRNVAGNKLIFINDAVENVNLPTKFDVVITPFLFDNFKEKSLVAIFDHIGGMLNEKAIWLTVSFQLTGKWWQRVMLQSMFVFFKLICGIEASRLPAIGACFERKVYKLVGEKNFFKDFIGARVYRK